MNFKVNQVIFDVLSNIDNKNVNFCMSGLLRVRVCHEVVDKSLVQVFELMEQNKKSLGIIDYSVSPTTLELSLIHI